MRSLLFLLPAWLSATTFAASLSAPLTYPNVAAFLGARPDVTTVDAFLHELPKEYRDHYVLMHTSESLQGSSFERPRVLVAGLDGNFALAFTGSDAEARGNTVEMYHYDREQRSYEFREITFTGGKAILSAANPPLCLGCHGRDPRPIWGSYPVWKGAYAEFRSHGRNDDSPEIKEKNQLFYEEQPTLPRYRELVTKSVDEQSDHNVGLTHLIQETNEQRVARLMASTPFYRDYKFALLGAHLCQDSADNFLSRFLPAPLAEAHRRAFRPEMMREQRPGAFELYAYLFDARGISTAEWATVIDPLDPRTSSRFSMTDPTDFDSDSAGHVAYWFAKVDPELENLARVGYAYRHGVVTIDGREFLALGPLETKDCDALAAQSRRQLDELLRQRSADEIFRASAQLRARTPRENLNRCADCHNGTAPGIPRLPFGDAATLATELHRSPALLEKITQRTAPDAGRRQMPPNGPLPAEERMRLLEFLRAL